MRIDSTLVLFCISLLTIAGVHQLAVTWYLYWTYPWLDLPMHTLGGAIIVLGAHTELYRKTTGLTIERFWAHIILVLGIGVLWELFEWQFVIVDMTGYVQDTLSDLVCDIFGGTIGFVVASAFKKYSL